MYCTDITYSQELPGKTEYRVLPCKRWTCEHCKPIRRWQLMKEARKGEPTIFLTLTANPKFYKSPENRARRLVEAWRKVRRIAMKEQKLKSLPFLAVFEATKAGEPHLHILCRARWIDQRWLSKQMERFMRSPIVDVRRVKNTKQAATYIAKYLGKDPHHFHGTKRYWRSLDWFLNGWRPEDEKTPKGSGFNVFNAPIQEVARTLINLGNRVEWFDGGFWVETRAAEDFLLIREAKIQHDVENNKRRRRKGLL